MSQDINIIERPMISNVNMDEHALVIDNGCIVHRVKFFHPIKLAFMGFIIPWFPIFDKCPINNLNATLQFKLMASQKNEFLSRWPLNLTTNGMINA
jgi:hypothetical protein